jgi:hypothetical protein
MCSLRLPELPWPGLRSPVPCTARPSSTYTSQRSWQLACGVVGRLLGGGGAVRAAAAGLRFVWGQQQRHCSWGGGCGAVPPACRALLLPALCPGLLATLHNNRTGVHQRLVCLRALVCPLLALVFHIPSHHVSWPPCPAVTQADVAKILAEYQARDLAFGIRVDELQSILGKYRDEAETLSQAFDNGSGTYVMAPLRAAPWPPAGREWTRGGL